jgi:hypothetical protein
MKKRNSPASKGLLIQVSTQMVSAFYFEDLKGFFED